MSEVFDHTHRRFVSYIDKSRHFYRSKGFENPYQWASHQETPFARLSKPLSEARIGLVTTAALNEEESKVRPLFAAPTEPMPGSVPESAPESAPESLYTHHLSWHKTATHTRDLDTFFPINRVRELVDQARIGSLSPRYYGLPTKYSQRLTNTEHAPAIRDFCRADQVDAVLLIPI